MINSNPVSIAIVEDDEGMRSSLEEILANEPQFLVYDVITKPSL